MSLVTPSSGGEPGPYVLRSLLLALDGMAHSRRTTVSDSGCRTPSNHNRTHNNHNSNRRLTPRLRQLLPLLHQRRQ